MSTQPWSLQELDLQSQCNLGCLGWAGLNLVANQADPSMLPHVFQEYVDYAQINDKSFLFLGSFVFYHERPGSNQFRLMMYRVLK